MSSASLEVHGCVLEENILVLWLHLQEFCRQTLGSVFVRSPSDVADQFLKYFVLNFFVFALNMVYGF